MPVVVISSRGFAEIVRSRGGAPQGGNFSFIEKPDGVAKSLDDFRREVGILLSTMTGNGTGPVAARPSSTPLRSALPAGTRMGAASSSRFRLIAVGASKGGVEAVTAVLPNLQKPLPPFVLVLHMPAPYPPLFARRLANVTGHDVEEARDGEQLAPGQIRVAPGSHHLRIENRGGAPVTRLGNEALVSGHKPSVDVLFGSVAEAFDRSAMGIILTGMGRDGADGLLQMRKAGAVTLGQSGDTCIVYGMPKAAMDLGAVQREVALPAMGSEIMRALGA
jgi:two-component system chemotaxis response regulator CheB